MIKRTYFLLFWMIFSFSFVVSFSQDRIQDSIRQLVHGSDESEIPRIFLEMAEFLNAKQHSIDSVDFYLNKALYSSLEIKNHPLSPELYRKIGELFGKIQNEEKAENAFNLGLEHASLMLDTIAMANIHYTRGIFYFRQVKHDLFIQNILKAIEYFEATGNSDQQGKALITLGVQYARLKDIDAAIEKLLKAQKIESELSTPVRLYLLLHLGKNYRRKALADSNDVLLQKSLSILEKGVKLADSIQSLGQMGDFRLALHDTYTVLDPPIFNDKLANEVIEIGNETNDHFLVYQGNLAKAQMLVIQKKYSLAFRLKDDMEAALNNLNNPVYKRSFHEVSYEISKALNKNKDALYHLENFKLLNDSILDLERTKLFNEINAKYENEKNESEILRLSNDKEKLKFQNELTQSKLKNRNLGIILISLLSISTIFYIYHHQTQKRVLAENQSLQVKQQLVRAQMNPHFIFNSLNGIKRFYVEGKTDLANDFLADFSKLLRKILDRSDTTEIPISEEVEFLKLYLDLEKVRLQDKLDYSIDFQEDDFEYDDYIPSFVIQPLVENAIWHGILPTNDAGKINVRIIRAANSIQIMVEDNGVGLQDNQKDLVQHRSKGLNLIRERLGKQGKLELLNNDGEGQTGTVAIITLIIEND